MWRNRLSLFAILFLITSLITVPFSSSPAFATHTEDPRYEPLPTYEGYEPLRFYMIYASAYEECERRDLEKIQFFDMVSMKYLRMIGFLPISTNAYACVQVEGAVEYDKDNGSGDFTFGLTLSEALRKAGEWDYDLLILIFDSELSRQYFLETRDPKTGYGNLGHVSYGNNGIVSTAHLNNIEDQKEAWTLTHELAHIGYYQLGYPRSVYGGNDVFWNGAQKSYVHQMDDIYDDCVDNNFRFANCSDSYVLMKTRYSGDIKVLRPYEPVPEPVEIKPTPAPVYPEPEPICRAGTVLKNGVCVISTQPVYPEPTAKYPTELTLFPSTTTPTEGETVYFQGMFRYFCNDGSCVFGTSPGEKVTIQTSEYYELPNGEIGQIFLAKGFVASDGTFKIPWTADQHFIRHFDGKSYWFIEAMYEGNEKYLSTSVEGLDIVVYDKPIQSKPYTEPEPSFSDKIFEKRSALSEKLEDLKREVRITNYQSSNAQGTLQLATDLLSQVNSKISSSQRMNDQDAELILDSASIDIDWAISFMQKAQNLEQEFQKNEQSQEIIELTPIQPKTKLDPTESELIRNDQIKKEIQSLRNSFVDATNDIEKSVKISEKSLTGLTFQKKEAQEKINFAWDLLKDSKKRVDAFDNYYLKNIDEASKSNYLEGVDRNVDAGTKSARQAGENLVKISELIEEAKALEKQKFCFLWWCW